MTTIQDRIETLKNIFFANGVKCDSEQFLIEDINNFIKEVEEETRKETLEELENKLYDNWHIVNGSWKDMYKFLQSITNKEIKK